MQIFRIVIVIVCLSLIYLAMQRKEKGVDGFAIHKIHSEFAYDPKWDVPFTPERYAEANTILRQPFYYLGRGFQCYVFVSADDKYVLKFFRHQRLRLPAVYCLIPSWIPLKETKQRAVDKRKRKLFETFKLGFEKLPQETGSLFLHLNKTEGMHPTVQIVDKSGTSYEVALDDTEFFLQKKATLLTETFETLMKNGNQAQAKERIDQIFALVQACADKGIVNADTSLVERDNIGFLADRAVYIDMGRFAYKKRAKVSISRELARLEPFYQWLQHTYPELAEYYAFLLKPSGV